MDIAVYIKELLYRYECVIVPNFGAFLTTRSAATIDERTNAFHPPKKTIAFNSQLQHNDGLLANYMVSFLEISYPDAVQQIDTYTRTLHQELASGKKITLDHIGTFFTAIENTLQFEPLEETTNYLPEAFGLTSFVAPTIKREDYKKEVTALEETTPIAFTPEKRNTDRPYLKYAAIAVIALGIAGFWGLKTYSDTVVDHNTIALKNAHKNVEHQIEMATFEISNPLPAINLNILKENTPTSQTSYHIIAGAYRISENADKKVLKLKTQGFEAKRVGTNKYGLHQVAYSSYTHKTDALRYLKEIKTKHNVNAWLLVASSDIK